MKKKLKIIVIFIFIFPVILIFTSNFLIKKNAVTKTFTSSTLIKKNKVGLVLGTSKFVRGGGVNLYFQYRINATVELYKKGKIDFILVSGDNGTKYYDEPTAFKKELIKNGIPKNRIFLDYAGFRTLDSVVRAKEVFGQFSLTIISQKFHNERAIYIAEKHGISAIGFNAKDVTGKYGLKTRIREYFAKTKAFLDIIFGKKPKFLGSKIKIK